jgi:hypothetical protein
VHEKIVNGEPEIVNMQRMYVMYTLKRAVEYAYGFGLTSQEIEQVVKDEMKSHDWRKDISFSKRSVF